MKAMEQFHARHPKIYCAVRNVVFAVRSHSMRLYFEDEVFRLNVKGNPDNISLVSPSRHYKYSQGISRRLDRLARIYFLDKVDFRPGDIFVDCGANIGEIGMWLAFNAPGTRYVAIEPGSKECAAIKLNVPDACVDRIAFWNSDGEQDLHLASETADTSLFAPNSSASVERITTRRLDGYLDETGLDSVKLLKIEAEGAEPEVIEGLGDRISRVRFIAVDMGPERYGNQNTVATCVDMLAGRGFSLLHFNHARCTGLFGRPGADGSGALSVGQGS